MTSPRAVSHAEMLLLKRWNTPTVYNGWEQITRRDAGHECFNIAPTTDFMPEMGPMVGRAITLVIEPGNPRHSRDNPEAWTEYRRYVASVPGPKIVVVQDLDKPAVLGSFWGEVNSNVHRALGCVGTICDGAIRDLDEMKAAGFKALARRLCVGHAFSCHVAWGRHVEAFGVSVAPGQLIHADKHGFLAVPPEDEPRLLEAALFMDANECNTLIPAARSAAGQTTEQTLAAIEAAAAAFREATQEKFARRGEW
ncbi:MAG: RraA family protein [Planctomycetota bacterium]|nr:RraA family protein [Planctomycetota bacterium]